MSVGQANPIGQVMWVSNPLEGYRIPSSAVHRWSTLSKHLDGPQSQGLSGARRQSDGEPPPRCTGPWLLPTHHRWVCLSPGGPLVTTTHSRCMEVCAG
uniref:Uncharacterized protein n=1 Tax=Knipowitschia caucasica TaxID=637954 RepID=A0AAV2L440_KNICA